MVAVVRVAAEGGGDGSGGGDSGGCGVWQIFICYIYTCDNFC